MFCIAPVNVIVTSHAYRFEIIRVKSPAWVVLIRYDVMHQRSSAYLPCLLPALLAFIMIPAQDVWTHLLPGR